MNYYFEAFKKYAVFKGRATRSEFWTFTLINCGIVFFMGVLMGLMNNVLYDSLNGDRANLNLILAVVLPISILILIFELAVIIPSISVAVRRLHDTNRSGWWVLLWLVPFIGQLWLLILLLADGQAGDNKYGSSPKIITSK